MPQGAISSLQRHNNNLNLRGLKIVLDCAHGATYQIAPAVFAELGAQVISMGVEPNGFEYQR